MFEKTAVLKVSEVPRKTSFVEFIQNHSSCQITITIRKTDSTADVSCGRSKNLKISEREISAFYNPVEYISSRNFEKLPFSRR